MRVRGLYPNPLGCPPTRAPAVAGSPPPSMLRLRKVSCPRAPPPVTAPHSAAQWSGNTALIWAASNGHLEVVKQLLEAGADKDVQNKVQPRGLRARLRAWRRSAWGAADLRVYKRFGGGGTIGAERLLAPCLGCAATRSGSGTLRRMRLQKAHLRVCSGSRGAFWIGFCALRCFWPCRLSDAGAFRCMRRCPLPPICTRWAWYITSIAVASRARRGRAGQGTAIVRTAILRAFVPG